MKRALLLSVLALGACTPTFLESGRYACEPGQPDQCPGAWRCGLEGYCHQLRDTSVAWRCETDADCEADFVCGLSRSREFHECHDPAAPQDWPCERPSDCVGGWTCGLTSSASDARQCHDPAAPKAWPCETSADCVAGWSCGLMSDGEHRECHDPLNPRAWTCRSDDDCLGGWRCGTERVCVDPSADALGTLVLAAVDGGAHVNSLRSRSPVSALTVSPFYAQGRGSRRSNLAFVQDGHLHAMSFDTVTGAASSYDLGAETPLALAAHGARGTNLQENPDDVDRLSVLWADGGLTTFRFADGGSPGREVYGNGVAAYDLLGQGSAGAGVTPSVYAVGSRPGGTFLRIDGDWAEELYLDAINAPGDRTNFSDVPGNRIHAITGLRYDDRVECVYLVDERGLWVAQRGWPSDPLGGGIASYDFEPVRLEGFTQRACAPGAAPQVKSVTGMDERWLALTAQAAGGALQVSIVDAAGTWVNRGGVGAETLCGSNQNRPCDPDDRLRAEVVMGPCAACPVGTRFAGLSMVSLGAGRLPALEVVCGQPNVPSAVFRLTPSASPGECVRTLITGPSSFFTAPSPQQGLPAAGTTAWSGAEGQLWFGTEFANLASLTFDRAPLGVARRGPGPDDWVAFTPQLVGTPTPSLGLLSSTTVQLIAPVAHAPTLVVSGNTLRQLDGGTIGYASALTLDAPVSASGTRSSQGGRVAVVSANTMIFAGDVEQVLAGTGAPGALPRRLTTLEPIMGLAFPETHAAGAGPVLAGYAIVGSNVVSVIADTLARWRTESVALPPTLLPRATWFQGAKARVAMQDGSVFSLPSRVRISQPLPGGDAVDYAQTCGQQLALAPDGLYRLETDPAGPVGQWRRLQLPPEVSALDFTEGRVHGLGRDVFVFTRLGEAARVTFDTCPE